MREKEQPAPVTPPSRRELFTLRLMILLGTVSIGVLLTVLFRRTQIGYAPLYWVLMAAITFNCLTILHEWYHYAAIRIPPSPPPQHPFTVDVLTTYFPGEPYDMIVNTLTAIRAMTYPHTAWLCDEANDPYLREVCARLGVRHVTRTNRKDAKAGNINNALQYATGELCVVMDPDHVPAPDFLDAVVHHFNDPGIGFVQIVQAYSNLGDNLIAKGAAQQTFQFYGPIMSTMNSYGTVLAIGANCTFRRAALDSIGGHASGLAEDMHTAMHLHAKGWKSIYVPAVLTRGLVPNTLSAYYAQQLKWARGTFELLVTTYPRLFRQFTWLQRLHYGTIPLHYLSGVVFLINFLVPVLSLVTGYIPFRADLVQFSLLAFPAIASIILIRHYVQRWVMEETERGFHVVGGLLFIGTWWIYLLGLIYTIARKRVPYLPTPKDDSGPDDWRLNLPNIVILVISLAAIIYGLSHDWNPYSLFMAGIAGINCLIMVFNIMASLQLKKIPARYGWVKTILTLPLFLKRQFWIFRHLHLYTGIRKLGLPLLLVVIVLSWYFTAGRRQAPVSVLPSRQDVFYTGAYNPSGEGLPRTQITSLYIAWGDGQDHLLPDSLTAIYNSGSIPMVTWEPWTSRFTHNAGQVQQERKVMSLIPTGIFDSYLEQFADQVKALNRPLFLRFAHEPDNPAYPWSPTGGNTPEEYGRAWRYVHTLFLRRGAINAVWVWSPWKASNAEKYFPGKEFVDWIGVTALNYGPAHGGGAWYSFEALYQPFHQLPLFRSGLPVMIAEMGSASDAGDQARWFSDAFLAISNRFPEVHAQVFFNTGHDVNVVKGDTARYLDWSIRQPGQLLAVLDSFPRLRGPAALNVTAIAGAATVAPVPHHPLPDNLRGLRYQKGEDWFRNRYALTRRETAHDLQQMQQLGVNTIRRYGPGVYDRNVLSEARSHGIHIHYGFWLPDVTDMDKDSVMLARAQRDILRNIARRRNDTVITAWQIGNNAWQQLGQYHFKPALLYQQQRYLRWLEGLARAIKATDPSRPVTTDVLFQSATAPLLPWLRQQLPAIDAFGIETIGDTTGLAALLSGNVPCFISKIPVASYAALSPVPAFITTWQDLETRDYVTFDGLIDHRGRHKPAWEQLSGLWSQRSALPSLPKVKILRPSRTTLPGSRLTYHALVSTGAGWRFADPGKDQLQFEWYLVQTDRYGNPFHLQPVGKGASFTLTVPDKPMQYRLYLEAARDSSVVTGITTLNTPLY
ncbi:Glycosyltransferase, catalytic subunit of cellulose synthase and poly-beta-1,6-N-acetylglucosamine synthase [Chitinophaga eiseniae]|uniref:Glycosyltransferase, catalytic subunit of cellulose synthase and poly-beta-1,6-N-acetylglucosamine synthase n=1 Tax=Chitinophaga eiseniae TaxID=634771 RepID=A0A1T4T9P6_9BACT|nr:glycosyltransferase family 2 protein [Chitinophaga eiseniae]SKA36999.1 Glycosyltransferase, catalytic subunit of cellulose synthase and poly-beta-1,6-N-acetylglucosamine synthase [Chitinophaga eiseniae]